MFKGKTSHGVDIKATQGMDLSTHRPAWYVVASNTGARIMTVKAHAFELVEVLDHPDGRKKESAFGTDSPGRTYDSHSQKSSTHGEYSTSSHSFSKEESLAEHEANRFAKTVMDRLEILRTQNRFGKLTLVAESKFLGRLGSHGSQDLLKCIENRIAKDIAHLALEDLATKLLAK